MQCRQSGYIMVLTLMIIALSTAIITKIYYQSSAFAPFAEIVVKREKAKMLALGGVQMAISKLVGSDKKEEDSEKDAKWKNFLERILPGLNRWEKYDLSYEKEQVKGTVEFCVSCEDGKLNINKIYEYQAPSTILPQDEALLKQLLVQVQQLTKDKVDAEQLLNSWQKFMEDRTTLLIDTTELLKIPEWQYFKDFVFYQPSKGTNKDDNQEEQSVCLTDIFTVWSDKATVQPWLLSDSLQALMGFARAQSGDIIKREQVVSEWLSNYKDRADWARDWDSTLGLVYKVDVNNLPKQILEVFDPVFDPKVFSVVSRGTVGGVTQKLLAIIKRQSKKTKDFYTIEKLYWI